MTASKKPPTPTENTRQRMLRAAMKLFTQLGYEQASTRAIAEAAGVNEVTLFRHFGNKKALLMACVEAHNAVGFAATFEAEISGDYPADIQMMAERQVADMRANVATLRMLLCDARNVPELREALFVGGRGNLERLRRYFQVQIQAGGIRQELSAQALAIAFDSLFSSSVLFEHIFQDSYSPEMKVEVLLNPLVDLFVRGTQRAVSQG
ncbi:MAG: TetR/AcrR family transcriptional regulator [Anaerolineales bacterium]|nr:TetR/AcrR family transcriptional regulator [Anaerolineales bacterium]